MKYQTFLQTRIREPDRDAPQFHWITAKDSEQLCTDIASELLWMVWMVIFYWLQDKQCYKQFVSDKGKNVNKKPFIRWTHTPSQDNPADLGKRKW